MALTIRQALKRAEEELAEVEARVAEQRRIVDGLRVAVERYTETDVSPAVRRDPGRMPRTDAVLAALSANRYQPLSAAELVPLVGSLRNTTETGGAISAALSYLKDRGKVRVEPGLGWMLASAPTPPDPGDVDPDDIPF